MRLPTLNSLPWKFLALTVPTILVVNVGFVLLFEWREFEIQIQNLHAKQDRVMASQTIILAEPVYKQDVVQITLTTAPILSDPEIVSALVRDPDGVVIVSFGDPLEEADPKLVREQPIRFATNSGFTVIGSLTTAVSDERIVDGLVRRLTVMAVLTLMVSVVVICGIQMALRFTVVRPLHRLLASIDQTHRGSYQRVPWESPDEIGQVIRSFNDMQQRQERSESELEEARATLERRVEERTAALHAAFQRAEAANVAKSQFLANMSHELRTPLTAVIGFADLIRHESFGSIGDTRYRDYADDIARGGEHLLKLINDILDLSKAEAGKLELSETVFSTADVVDACVTMVSARAEKGRVSVWIAGRETMPLMRGDERKVVQILTNLLSNAVKFTPEGGEVEITCLGADDGIQMTVRDTGIGIAEADLPTLMQPFTQLESQFDRQYEGSGLGLPLTKRLIELHGGAMTVNSVVGQGTTVTARFPAERLVRDFAMAVEG